MAYRPQSPDLSQVYRPQSPDLSSLEAQGAPRYDHIQPRHFLGEHNQFAPRPQQTSDPFAGQNFQQPYSGMARVKHEDSGYLPDANAQVKPEQTDPTLGVVLKTSFPVARIKRIMQADEDIGKVAQVTPHVVSRALELFMIKLITASCEQARGTGNANAKGPRRVLVQHMKKAIQADDKFDFLAEIVSKVPDAPVKANKKEAAGSDSEEAKPKKKSRKKKDDD